MAGAARSVWKSLLATGRFRYYAIQSCIEAPVVATHGVLETSALTPSSSPSDCAESPLKSGRAASHFAREVALGQLFLQLRIAAVSSSVGSVLQQPWKIVRQYGTVAFDFGRCTGLPWGFKGSLDSTPLRNHFMIGGVRYKQKQNKSAQRAKRGAKKVKAKEVRKKLQRMRMEKRLRKASMSAEETLVYRIERLRKKIALHEQQLTKYELPEFPEPDPDPEILTPEQLYALKKLGYKNKNYVPVGRRGIYGGTIQNMHMHWKKHETVRIDCDNFPKEKIKGMGEQLERLSGGKVIDIHQATTIIMWRGRNYTRPKVDIPEVFKNFNKRKALLKSKHEQSIGSLYDSISQWEKELKQVRANMALEAAERARRVESNPGLASPEPAPRAAVAVDEIDYDSDDISDLSDADDVITTAEDLGDYDFDDSDEFSDGTIASHNEEASDIDSNMDNDTDSDEYSDIESDDDDSEGSLADTKTGVSLNQEVQASPQRSGSIHSGDEQNILWKSNGPIVMRQK